MNELYAQVFAEVYGLEPIGLRYFNVFGRRQDPNGQYAAVIPRWIAALRRHAVHDLRRRLVVARLLLRRQRRRRQPARRHRAGGRGQHGLQRRLQRPHRSARAVRAPARQPREGRARDRGRRAGVRADPRRRHPALAGVDRQDHRGARLRAQPRHRGRPGRDRRLVRRARVARAWLEQQLHDPDRGIGPPRPRR
jgi:hypothetical protein